MRARKHGQRRVPFHLGAFGLPVADSAPPDKAEREREDAPEEVPARRASGHGGKQGGKPRLTRGEVEIIFFKEAEATCFLELCWGNLTLVPPYILSASTAALLLTRGDVCVCV